jgi:uncharacterized protein (TIGR02145 family)
MKLRSWLVQGRALLLAAAMLAVGASNVLAQGTFTDKRDGKTYKTVEIGGKTWMAQNLNYRVANSWCSENHNPYCIKYGRLYDWNAAKTACPSGWHLPSSAEWDALVNAVGSPAGTKLKSKSSWSNYGRDNSTDEYGFSALSGGTRYPDDTFDAVGTYGNWWTGTEGGGGKASSRKMETGKADVSGDNDDARFGFSVRCVGD